MRFRLLQILIFFVLVIATVNAAIAGYNSTNGKWGYIDRTGAFVIAPRFDQAQSFTCVGTAIVCEGRELRRLERSTNGYSEFPPSPGATAKLEPAFGFETVKIGSKYGLMDSDGNLIYNPVTRKFAVKYRCFFNGLACVRFGQRFGYINREGDIVIEPRFKAARDFTSSTNTCYLSLDEAHWCDALAAVCEDDKWGYINNKGNYVIEPKFAEAGIFMTGLAPVKVSR